MSRKNTYIEMKEYGLIGHPLGHSFSRNFFTEKFYRESIDAAYLNFDIPNVGMLADIAVALSDMKVSILYVNSQKRTNGRGIITLKISCKNIDHYNSIVARLKTLDGVESVARGFS